MSTSDLKNSVLNAVEGFTQLAQVLDALKDNGSDFQEKKWETGNTVAKLHPKRLSLKVENIRVDTPTTKTLRLTSTKADQDGNPTLLPPFQAGQYINLFVNIDGVESARPYAISSSPKERRYYDITVKCVEEGFVSPYLVNEVTLGQTLSSTGPMGTFYHNPIHHGKDLVFLAGGSGIAPAMSMLKAVLDFKLPYQFYFIYASSYAQDVIFQQELRELAQKYENFKLIETITRPSENFSGRRGRVTEGLLKETLGSLDSKMFYICGPTPFNEHCESELKKLNVEGRRIRIEANGPPRNPESIEGWPAGLDPNSTVNLTIHGKGSFKVRVGEPILNSLERNKQFVENACRSGECSLCRVKLLSGKVYNPPQARVRKSDQQFGWMHSCVAYPITDIEILI